MHFFSFQACFLSLILLVFGSVDALFSQLSLSPEKPGFAETVTLTFNAKEGNQALADYKGDVYLHTGLINDESEHQGDWKKVVSGWNENLPKLKMDRKGDNLYELKFNISELYGIPPAGNVTALAFVLRSEDGSLVGKAKGEQDIFIFFKEANFKKAPVVFPESLAKEPEWTKDATIYEVNLRQYSKEGSINAFAKDLPRLKKLGVDILWFMPIHPIGLEERKGSLGSYYSIKDYKDVNPEFGNLADFKKLVKDCHEMGFKVILDWVANHSSRDIDWIEKHPDWYNRDADGKIIAPYDWTDVADLNYNNQEMREAMIDALTFWIKDCDIDGYRCDVAGEVPLDFWEEARIEMDKIKPIWMLAENADQTYLMNSAFNANYGWPFHHIMNEIAEGHESAEAVMDYFDEIEMKYPKGSYPMQFITNHDENSWAGTVEERLGASQSAMAVLSFTVPGIPLIYSGQEVGMKKRLKFFEKDPIDWSDKSLIPFYSKLNEMKADNPSLWNGEAGGWIKEIPNSNPDKVLTFSREKEGNQVLVAINLSDSPTEVKINKAGDGGMYEEYFTENKQEIVKGSSLKLDAWEYKVFIRKEIIPAPPRTFISSNITDNGLQVETSDGIINISSLSNNAVEVEFVADGYENPISESIDPNVKRFKPSKGKGKRKETYSLGSLQVVINKEPFNISFEDGNGTLISEERGYFENQISKGFRFNLSSEEKLNGGGERVLGMDRRGKRLKLYNQASYGYETEAELMYYSMPVVISSKKYMLVFDNGASGYINMGVEGEEDVLQFEAVGGRMSYYLVVGQDWKGLAENFTEVTGRQPMVPRWALGNIASRMGYHSQEEVSNVVDKYLEDDIPLDAVVLDLYWFGPDLKGHLGNLEWDKNTFPEPEEMMKGFKEKGVKTILITEPFVIEGTNKFDEVVAQELVGKDISGKPYIYDFYFGTTTLLDIFKPETKKWFWDIYKRHTLSGVDGWWGDLGEPEVHPKGLLHINGGADEVHNLYGHEWAKMIYEGYAKDFASRRPLILMRSGFVGSQRYGMVPWSGDVNRSWGGLKPQVEIGLTMGMQGMAYMHSDLGGFAGDYKDAELYTRWLQYGVFQPVYRTHAQEEVPAEPIFWDEDTKRIVRKFIKLRYALTAYNYTLAYENAIKGTPMMRPLFYLDDKPSLLEHTDSYLWGDAFLVSPVTEKGETKHKVYLPAGHKWVNYWTNEVLEGGREIEVPVDINTIPVFVKAGSFIPMVNNVQSLSDYSSEKIKLHYYHDQTVNNSSGMMYDDDGETKESYLKNEFELINFESSYQNGSLKIKVDPNDGVYEGKPEKRKVDLIVHGMLNRPMSLTIDGVDVGISEQLRESRGQKYSAIWDSGNKLIRLSFELTDRVVEVVCK